LALWGGEAKALTIRYNFAGGSNDYTGGTIDVASLDQALGTGPVTFTVEVFGSTKTVVASYSLGSSSEIDFQTTACGGVCFESWNPSNFNFGSVPGGTITSSTTWRSLLGTFSGTNFGAGAFTWSTSAPQQGGTMTPPPSSITFSDPNAPVPGPLPVFGAAAAFGWSRRLRKRISANSGS
jgi:hypothetical protein